MVSYSNTRGCRQAATTGFSVPNFQDPFAKVSMSTSQNLKSRLSSARTSVSLLIMSALLVIPQQAVLAQMAIPVSPVSGLPVRVATENTKVSSAQGTGNTIGLFSAPAPAPASSQPVSGNDVGLGSSSSSSQFAETTDSSSNQFAQTTGSPSNQLAQSTNSNSDTSAQSAPPPTAANTATQSTDSSSNQKLKGHVIVPANPYRGVNNSTTPFAPEGTERRALPAPLDPVFPSTEYVGIASQIQIGVPDQDQMYPLEKAIYKACPYLAKKRIKMYGWINPGVNYSSSHHSNIPLSYAIVPRRIELDQAIFRIERVPDTVQNQHGDWGFRATILYGIDYRWTTAEGWFPASSEFLRRNKLYGLDPMELYGCYYTPKIAQGTVFKFGRFISPPDIEAQLAPDNYMWSHSQMFTEDCYTLTGALASIKLNDHWMAQLGITAGNDQAPWARSAKPTGLALLRWQGNRNRDMIYGGVNSIGNGQYSMSGQHDQLQQFNLTWFHRFNRRFHIATEAYFIYEFNALRGGTVSNGPFYPYDAETGPGMFMPGMSQAWGLVSYWNYKVTDRDYISFRPVDYLWDPNGVRTGFPTTLTEWSIGWCHHFSDLLLIRPEIRLDRSLAHIDVYDNGTRRFQFTFGFDLIQRF